MKTIVAVLIILLIAVPVSAQTPEKRGIALACGDWVNAQSHATWVMDWGHSSPSFQTYKEAYVPMIRGWGEFRRTYPTTTWDSAIMVYSQAMTWPGRYWLLGNEPNDVSQDNYTPAEAVHVYSSMGRYVTWADPSSKLLLGGLAFGGTTYMSQMLALWPPDVPLAGLQWHVYVWDTTADKAIVRAKARIDEVVKYTHDRNPAWKIWISEYGMLGTNWFSVEDNARYLSEVTAYLDAHVDRYAFFTWDDGCMTFQSISLADNAAYIAAFTGQ